MADETTGNAGNTENNVPQTGAPPQGAPVAVPQSENFKPAANIPTSAPPPETSPIQDDMARILQGIKLPERRDAPGAPAAKAAPSPPPAPPEPPKAEPKPEADQSSVAGVHTFKQDLQGVVRDQKISVVRAVAFESEKRRPMPELEVVQPPRKSRVPGIIFTVFLLLLLGGAALGGVYYIAAQKAGTTVNVAPESILFAEQTAAYSVDGKSPQTIKSELEAGRASSGTLGSITRVAPVVSALNPDGQTVQRLITFPEFVSALAIAPPESLMRALGTDFFFGFHTVDENAPILVIPVTSYENAFAGMLAWEKSLNADLSPIFTAVPRLVAGADGIPVERTFSDKVFRNYDVRALSDDQDQIQLYYAFPTRDILIIAESPYTFTEVLSRLQAARRI